MKHKIVKRWQRMTLQAIGTIMSFVLFGGGLMIPIHWLGFLFCFSGGCGIIVCTAFFVNEL